MCKLNAECTGRVEKDPAAAFGQNAGYWKVVVCKKSYRQWRWYSIRSTISPAQPPNRQWSVRYCAIGLLQSSRVGKGQTMLRVGERSDEGQRVRAGSGVGREEGTSMAAMPREAGLVRRDGQRQHGNDTNRAMSTTTTYVSEHASANSRLQAGNLLCVASRTWRHCTQQRTAVSHSWCWHATLVLFSSRALTDAPAPHVHHVHTCI